MGRRAREKVKPRLPRRAVTVYLEAEELERLSALASTLGVTKSRALGALLMGGTLKRLLRLTGLPEADEESVAHALRITRNRAGALKEIQAARAAALDDDASCAEGYEDEDAYEEDAYAEAEEDEDDGEWYR